MNIRQRRALKGLKAYTVAYELGIDYNKYMEIERGERQLGAEYLDKFMEILENAKEIKLNRMEKIKQMNEEFENGTMINLVKEMGYTHKSLGEELGMSQSSITNNLGNNARYITEETRERIYDFLHNPINKKYTKTTKVDKRRGPRHTTIPTEKWKYLNDTLDKYGITRSEFAKGLPCTAEHISNVIKGARNASPMLEEAMNDKLKKMLKDLGEKEEEPKIELKTIETPNTNVFKDFNVVEETHKVDIKENSVDGIDIEKEFYKDIIRTFIKLIEKI